MIEKVIKLLERLGYSYVKYNAEESSESCLRFFGEDQRGFYLEFQFTPSDGFLMDRAVGSKYWDLLEKVTDL